MTTDKNIYVFEILAQINKIIIAATEITPETISEFNEDVDARLGEYLSGFELAYNNLSIFYLDTEIFKIEAIQHRPVLKFVNAHPEIAESNNLYCYKLLISLKINNSAIEHVSNHIETSEFNLNKLKVRLGRYMLKKSVITNMISKS